MNDTNPSTPDLVALTSVQSKVYHKPIHKPARNFAQGYTLSECGFEIAYLVPWEEIAQTRRPCIRCYPPDAD